MNFEYFGKIYESEKINCWEKYYLNYNSLVNDIKSIVDCISNLLEECKKQKITEQKDKEKKDKNINFETNSKKSINDVSFSDSLRPTLLSIIKERNNNSFAINDSLACINNLEKNKNIIEEKIKVFFDTLDKEIKKINIFYSSQEKDIYQKINKRIKNQTEIKGESNSNILKELDLINYLCELCSQIIIFIYWNIKALKNILFIFDNSTYPIIDSMSFGYIKKHLSKNNSNLLYILVFKTLDETILSADNLAHEYEKILNLNNDFKNNTEQQRKIKEIKDLMKFNITNYNNFYEKIFKELSEWQKYLNINLGLPSSSNKSIFKNTTLVGDYSPANNKAINIRYKSFNELYNMDNEDIIQNLFKKFNDDDQKLLQSHNIELSELLMSDKDRISILSYKQNDIISNQNKINLNFLYFFSFFYNYSYSIFISFLYSYFYNFEDRENDYNKYYFLFGLYISFPYLGNIISQIYFDYIIKLNFKFVLLISLVFTIFYYIGLNILNLIDFNNEDKFYPYFLIIIFFSRLFLGLSPFKQICKEYINQYIPVSCQIRSNQKYLTFKYIGYFLGFLFTGINDIITSNSVEDTKNKKPKNYLLIISSSLFVIISIYALISFKNPTNKKFKILKDSFFENNRKNMITNNIDLEQDEKEIVKEQEIMFENANNLIQLSGKNLLKKYSTEVEKKNKTYLNKIFTYLIIFLITSQFTAENCIIFLSMYNINIFHKENEKEIDYFIGLFTGAVIYLLCLIMQKIISKKSSNKYYNRIILIFLSLIAIISFILMAFYNYNEKAYLCPIGNSIMICVADLFEILTVNLFIELMPIEEFKFYCFSSNSFIITTSKTARLLPGLIYVLTYFIQDFTSDKFYVNFAFNCMLFIISFMILLISKNLKPKPLTRLLYYSN